MPGEDGGVVMKMKMSMHITVNGWQACKGDVMVQDLDGVVVQAKFFHREGEEYLVKMMVQF